MQRMKPGSALLLIAAMLALAGCFNTPATDEGGEPLPECTFTNPVAQGQDPWVVKKDGRYYLIQSKGDSALYVYKSKALNDLKRNGARVWTPPDAGWNQASIWAPELHFIGGRWYIYYAAGRQPGPPFTDQRSGVLQSVGTDPQGAYVDKGMLYTGDSTATRTGNVWAIDVTVAQIGGQRYAVWSGWEENRAEPRTPQHLYIAAMADPWTIGSNRVKISSPRRAWEKGTELDLNEAPQFLRHDGHVFIIYSTRESWLPAYRLGQLRLKEGADPLEPESWVKSGPVFTGSGDVHGVGHASFTTSPDGTEDWIVYHSKADTAPGWDRLVRMQPFTWGPDGAPQFGRPVAPGEPISLPSGQGACG